MTDSQLETIAASHDETIFTFLYIFPFFRMLKIGRGHRVLNRRVLRHPGAAEVLFSTF